MTNSFSKNNTPFQNWWKMTTLTKENGYFIFNFLDIKKNQNHYELKYISLSDETKKYR